MTSSDHSSPDRDELTEALRIAQRLGVISAQDLDAEIDHCSGFVTCVPRGTARLVDLGSGGGLPGLVIAVMRPDISITLVERREKRADVLRRQVARLGIESQVTVECADIDHHRASSILSGDFDLVTARSFGTPLQTAVAAAHYLHDHGTLLVSEPPNSSGERWREVGPTTGLHLVRVESGIAVLTKNPT